jgi:hypothetical protein
MYHQNIEQKILAKTTLNYLSNNHLANKKQFKKKCVLSLYI